MGAESGQNILGYCLRNMDPFILIHQERAVEAFSYLVDYQRNQQLLLQIPAPLSPQPKPDIKTARQVIESALAEPRTILTTSESVKIYIISCQ